MSFWYKYFNRTFDCHLLILVLKEQCFIQQNMGSLQICIPVMFILSLQNGNSFRIDIPTTDGGEIEFAGDNSILTEDVLSRDPPEANNFQISIPTTSGGEIYLTDASFQDVFTRDSDNSGQLVTSSELKHMSEDRRIGVQITSALVKKAADRDEISSKETSKVIDAVVKSAFNNEENAVTTLSVSLEKAIQNKVISEYDALKILASAVLANLQEQNSISSEEALAFGISSARNANAISQASAEILTEWANESYSSSLSNKNFDDNLSSKNVNTITTTTVKQSFSSTPEGVTSKLIGDDTVTTVRTEKITTTTGEESSSTFPKNDKSLKITTTTTENSSTIANTGAGKEGSVTTVTTQKTSTSTEKDSNVNAENVGSTLESTKSAEKNPHLKASINHESIIRGDGKTDSDLRVNSSTDEKVLTVTESKNPYVNGEEDIESTVKTERITRTSKEGPSLKATIQNDSLTKGTKESNSQITTAISKEPILKSKVNHESTISTTTNQEFPTERKFEHISSGNNEIQVKTKVKSEESSNTKPLLDASIGNDSLIGAEEASDSFLRITKTANEKMSSETRPEQQYSHNSAKDVKMNVKTEKVTKTEEKNPISIVDNKNESAIGGTEQINANVQIATTYDKVSSVSKNKAESPVNDKKDVEITVQSEKISEANIGQPGLKAAIINDLVLKGKTQRDSSIKSTTTTAKKISSTLKNVDESSANAPKDVQLTVKSEKTTKISNEEPAVKATVINYSLMKNITPNDSNVKSTSSISKSVSSITETAAKSPADDKKDVEITVKSDTTTKTKNGQPIAKAAIINESVIKGETPRDSNTKTTTTTNEKTSSVTKTGDESPANDEKDIKITVQTEKTTDTNDGKPLVKASLINDLVMRNTSPEEFDIKNTTTTNERISSVTKTGDGSPGNSEKDVETIVKTEKKTAITNEQPVVKAAIINGYVMKGTTPKEFDIKSTTTTNERVSSVSKTEDGSPGNSEKDVETIVKTEKMTDVTNEQPVVKAEIINDYAMKSRTPKDSNVKSTTATNERVSFVTKNKEDEFPDSNKVDVETIVKSKKTTKTTTEQPVVKATDSNDSVIKSIIPKDSNVKTSTTTSKRVSTMTKTEEDEHPGRRKEDSETTVKTERTTKTTTEQPVVKATIINDTVFKNITPKDSNVRTSTITSQRFSSISKTEDESSRNGKKDVVTTVKTEKTIGKADVRPVVVDTVINDSVLKSTTPTDSNVKTSTTTSQRVSSISKTEEESSGNGRKDVITTVKTEKTIGTTDVRPIVEDTVINDSVFKSTTPTDSNVKTSTTTSQRVSSTSKTEDESSGNGEKGVVKTVETEKKTETAEVRPVLKAAVASDSVTKSRDSTGSNLKSNTQTHEQVLSVTNISDKSSGNGEKDVETTVKTEKITEVTNKEPLSKGTSLDTESTTKIVNEKYSTITTKSDLAPRNGAEIESTVKVNSSDNEKISSSTKESVSSSSKSKENTDTILKVTSAADGPSSTGGNDISSTTKRQTETIGKTATTTTSVPTNISAGDSASSSQMQTSNTINDVTSTLQSSSTTTSEDDSSKTSSGSRTDSVNLDVAVFDVDGKQIEREDYIPVLGDPSKPKIKLGIDITARVE